MSRRSHSRGRRSEVGFAAECVVQQLESRRLLCAFGHEQLPEAPRWSEAIEQEYASQQEGGPEAVSIVWTNRNTFDQGDFNYDGVANLPDFNARFGAVLDPASASSGEKRFRESLTDAVGSPDEPAGTDRLIDAVID
jgi:hypothetical protein